MATDFREKSALKIPAGSQLVLEVTSETATKVLATAFINFDGTTRDKEITHSQLWNSSASVALDPGTHVAEIDLDFHDAKIESVQAKMRIVSSAGTQLRSWQETYELAAPWIGAMQYVITVR